jgi:Holliday junction resolvase
LANGTEKHIKVMDISGRVVYKGLGSGDKIMVDINAQANGIYYVEVKSGDRTETIKVVKQ